MDMPTSLTTGGGVGGDALIRVDELAPCLFRNRHNQPNHRARLFGGQTIGQALSAATRTVRDWPLHHCSALFLRAGLPHLAVDYEVERLRDGQFFAARRVIARQAGRIILELHCSFHGYEGGPEHQRTDAVDLPGPERLESLASFVERNADRLPDDVVARYAARFPVEVRMFRPETAFLELADEPVRSFWFRVPAATGVDDLREHQCLLALASDYWLVGVAAAGHCLPVTTQGFSLISLNHSLWFHAPVRADEWLLYRTESPWAGQARGLARGLIYDCAGRLVASAAQEALMRFESTGKGG